MNAPHVAAAFPQQTRSFMPRPAKPDSGFTKLSVPNFATLNRELHAPDLSLIVTGPSQLELWRLLMRSLFDRRAWMGYPRLGPALAPQLLRLPTAAPIAVIDTEDFPYINRADLFLLSRCKYYFKRELPPDRWRLFTKTAHRALPTRRFRRQSPLRHLIDKIRPISLGLPSVARLPTTEFDKTTDVFVSGGVEGTSTVRKAGMSELVALRERGYRIDIAEGKLSPQDFYRRCAEAWIVWSPEGLGLGLLPPLRSARLRFGADDQPADHRTLSAADRRRPCALLRPGAGLPDRRNRSGARGQGPPAGDRARGQGACPRPSHARGARQLRGRDHARRAAAHSTSGSHPPLVTPLRRRWQSSN